MRNTGLKKTLKKIACITLAWIATTFSLIITIEAFFFGSFYRILPPNIPPYFDRGAHIFSQYSKAGDIPKNYIAIFGDSYAEGAGDWYLNNQLERMPDTQATHLLHKATGRDVVTFGLSATGSPNYIENPIASLDFIRSLWFYDIQDPEIIFIYFYEGNDIIDNNSEYKNRYLKKGYDPEKLNDTDYFEYFVYQEYLNSNETYQKAKSRDLSNNFLFTKLAFQLSIITIKSFVEGTRVDSISLEKEKISGNTTVIINEKLTAIPDTIETAPLDRTDEEYDVAIKFFENSIKLVKKEFPRSTISIVYIPSAGSLYKFNSDYINTVTEKPTSTYSTSKLIPASNALCEKIQAASFRNKIGFYDTRPSLRMAAKSKIIHGQADWNHFSESGYRVLATELEKLFIQISKSPDQVTLNKCNDIN